jgi:hypothetical protein
MPGPSRIRCSRVAPALDPRISARSRAKENRRLVVYGMAGSVGNPFASAGYNSAAVSPDLQARGSPPSHPVPEDDPPSAGRICRASRAAAQFPFKGTVASLTCGRPYTRRVRLPHARGERRYLCCNS